MNRLAVVALAASLALCTPVAAQGPLDLKIQAKKGASVWLLDEFVDAKVISMEGQEFETVLKSTSVLHLTVEDVDDKGRLVVTTRIARIHGDMSLPNAVIDFDSMAPADDDEADEDDGSGMTPARIRTVLLAGAGKSFRATIDDRGQGVELLDDAKDVLQEADLAARSGMGTTLTAASLRDLLRRAFGERPGQPVAIGATWRSASNDARELKLTRELKLAKADAATFEVAIASNAEAAKADGEEEGVAVVVNKNAPKAKDAAIRGVCRASRTDGFVLAAEETITATLEGAGPDGTGTVALSLRRSLQRTTAAAAEPKAAAPKPAVPASGGGGKR
ncbi:MAG: hypothetical protein ACK6DT_00785 [Planctomycetota bacterium]